VIADNLVTPHTSQASLLLQVNINRAAREELERLPGIGKVTADRIIAHREKYGEFRRLEHLMMVRGISEKKFREIRPLIVK
jgi:competence protein ComEA